MLYLMKHFQIQIPSLSLTRETIYILFVNYNSLIMNIYYVKSLVREWEKVKNLRFFRKHFAIAKSLRHGSDSSPRQLLKMVFFGSIRNCKYINSLTTTLLIYTQIIPRLNLIFMNTYRRF